MNKNYIGENIRIYRERKNLTQQQLADKIGKTWEMISRYERGVSSPINQIDILAHALGITPADLLKDITVDSSTSFTRIPLFEDIPSGYNFKKSNTYIYYNAPDWIVNADSDVFAINASLVSNQNGVLYISPNHTINLNDMVLLRESGNLMVTNLKSFQGVEVIGKVLAEEIRY